MPSLSMHALLAASLLHLGFQVVVTLVVYPALAGVRIDDWPSAHAGHSRRIGPVVGVVYGALVIAGAAAVAAGPTTATWIAVGAAGVAILTTAAVAGPAHLRLSPDRPEAMMRRLLAADRVRLVAAIVGAVAAFVAIA